MKIYDKEAIKSYKNVDPDAQSHFKGTAIRAPFYIPFITQSTIRCHGILGVGGFGIAKLFYNELSKLYYVSKRIYAKGCGYDHMFFNIAKKEVHLLEEMSKIDGLKEYVPKLYAYVIYIMNI